MKTEHMKAPYLRMKDYDHENVETGFTADRTLTVITGMLASIGVFAALVLAIAVMAQVPESWLSWLVLATWGV